MFARLFAARVQQEDYIISVFQWKHYDNGITEAAHSSAASRGPTVLRRGRGWEMFRPWRRRLFVGDSVESMMGWTD
jgi:hypothetical protein